MKHLARGTAIASVMALSLISHSAFAQKESKVAVVDVNSVVASMPEYVSANKKVTDLQTQYNDSLKTMETRFQTTQDTYSKLGETASPEAKKREQDDLTAQQTAMRAFYDSKFGQQGEIAQMQQQLTTPILKKVKDALEGFAKKEHYTMIMPTGSLIYFDPTMDVTTKFQDYLKAAK